MIIFYELTKYDYKNPLCYKKFETKNFTRVTKCLKYFKKVYPFRYRGEKSAKEYFNVLFSLCGYSENKTGIIYKDIVKNFIFENYGVEIKEKVKEVISKKPMDKMLWLSKYSVSINEQWLLSKRSYTEKEFIRVQEIFKSACSWAALKKEGLYF